MVSLSAFDFGLRFTIYKEAGSYQIIIKISGFARP